MSKKTVLKITKKVTTNVVVKSIDVDVKKIRKGFNLSQQDFADRFGFSVGTLRNWEQGRIKPSGATLVFLLVIEKHPDAVKDVLK